MLAKSTPWLLAVACLCGIWIVRTAMVDARSEQRARVAAMDNDEKDQLRRNQADFGSLSGEEQQRLRTLHEDLAKDPDSDELSALMGRYHEWVRSLPPWDQKELLKLDPAERVKKVAQWRGKEIALEKGQGPGKRPGFYGSRGTYSRGPGTGPGTGRGSWFPEELQNVDTKDLIAWLTDVAEKPVEVEKLRELISRQKGMDPKRVELLLEDEKLDAMRRGVGIVGLLFLSPNRQFGDDSEIANEYLCRAREKLAPSAVEFLQTQPPEKQWYLISALIVRHHMRERAKAGPPTRLSAPPPLSITDEMLAEHLESLETEDPEQFNRIMNLSSTQMEEQLYRSYLNLHAPGMGEHRPWSGPGGGGGGAGRGSGEPRGGGMNGGGRGGGGGQRGFSGEGRQGMRPPGPGRPGERPRPEGVE